VVAELTSMLDLPGWPKLGDTGDRAQGTLDPAPSYASSTPAATGLPGHRHNTASSPTWNYAAAKTPACATCLHAQNQNWCELVGMVCELLAGPRSRKLAATGTSVSLSPLLVPTSKYRDSPVHMAD
jgi:hypothetical protein